MEDQAERYSSASWSGGPRYIRSPRRSPRARARGRRAGRKTMSLMMSRARSRCSGESGRRARCTPRRWQRSPGRRCSKAWATPRASMSGVPLKSMCSIRWEMPATSSSRRGCRPGSRRPRRRRLFEGLADNTLKPPEAPSFLCWDRSRVTPPASRGRCGSACRCRAPAPSRSPSLTTSSTRSTRCLPGARRRCGSDRPVPA